MRAVLPEANCSGNVELTFLGHPFESLGRTLDPILAVIAVGRKQPDHLIGAAGGRTGNIAGSEIDSLSNGEFVLQRPLHHAKSAGCAHGPRCNGRLKTRALYSTAAAKLASCIPTWQMCEFCRFFSAINDISQVPDLAGKGEPRFTARNCAISIFARVLPQISLRNLRKLDCEAKPASTFTGIRARALPPSGTAVPEALGRMRELAVGAGVIDGGGKCVRQNLGELIDRDVVARGQLPDRVAAQHLLQLLGGDRQVLAVSDPGFDLIAEACLLQLGDDRGEPALAAIAEHFAEHDREYGAAELAECALE